MRSKCYFRKMKLAVVFSDDLKQEGIVRKKKRRNLKLLGVVARENEEGLRLRQVSKKEILGLDNWNGEKKQKSQVSERVKLL